MMTEAERKVRTLNVLKRMIDQAIVDLDEASSDVQYDVGCKADRFGDELAEQDEHMDLSLCPEEWNEDPDIKDAFEAFVAGIYWGLRNRLESASDDLEDQYEDSSEDLNETSESS